MGTMEKTITFYRSKIGLHFQHLLLTPESDETEKPTLKSSHMHEIVLLLAGSGKYVVDGQYYPLSPLDMLIINAGETQALYDIDTSQPYEYIFLRFEPNLFPSFNDFNLFAAFNGAKAFAHVIPKAFTEKYKLAEYIKEMEEICQSKSIYTDVYFISKIMHTATILNDCAEELISLQDDRIAKPARVNQLSHRCIQYINEHITEPLTVHDLAKALNVSVSHIHNTFKQQTHTTVPNYIFNQKMQLAQKLLTQGNPPQTVAKMLGYEYYSTFYYNYKKRFHMKPKAFVNLNRQLYDSDRDCMINLGNKKP